MMGNNAAAIATLSTTTPPLVPDFTSTEARDYPLIFDEQGNLYTGFEGTEGPTTSPGYFGRYDAAQLVGNVASAAPPALSIKPVHVATDLERTPSGDFVLVDGTAQLLRYTKAQMAQSGLIQATTPAATITLNATGTPAPTRIAVDPDGNWYLSQASTYVLKIASADGAKTGTVTLVPTMTLRAQDGDVNASFQAITVH